MPSLRRASALALPLLIACGRQEPVDEEAMVVPVGRRPPDVAEPAVPSPPPSQVPGHTSARPSTGPANDPGMPRRPDLLSLARGVVPLSWSVRRAKGGPDVDEALAVIDGKDESFRVVELATTRGGAEFIYRLPARTTFDRFAVPKVSETPGPLNTFFRRIRVRGSNKGSSGPWKLLARANLQTHAPGERVTELQMRRKISVRWLKVQLYGGIDIQGERSSYEFSELIGNGVQEPVPPAQRFGGLWRLGEAEAGGARIELVQQGALVAGCDDAGATLGGGVTGNVLRMRAVAKGDTPPSYYVVNLAPGGKLLGVRSEKGGSFKPYVAARVEKAEKPDGKKAADGEGQVEEVALGCAPAPVLGCGSLIYALDFDLDSADLPADAEPVLAALQGGLAATAGDRQIAIEVHTVDNAGDAAGERGHKLSRARARALVQALVARGMPAERLEAVGHGASKPLVDEEGEAGRALNRRIEVRCGD